MKKKIEFEIRRQGQPTEVVSRPVVHNSVCVEGKFRELQQADGKFFVELAPVPPQRKVSYNPRMGAAASLLIGLGGLK